jgi:hypothetical protein
MVWHSRRASHCRCRLAILGLTDQYVHQRIDPKSYIFWRREMDNHVATHNGDIETDVGTAWEKALSSPANLRIWGGAALAF